MLDSLMVKLIGEETAESPLSSVACAVIVWLPGARSIVVTDHLPCGSVRPDPIVFPFSSSSCIITPGSAVPEMVGVILAEFPAPVVMVGMLTDTAPVEVFIVIVMELEEADVPKVFVVVAVRVWLPSVNADVDISQCPSPSVAELPTLVVPSNNCTVTPTSAVPSITGELSA
jgi:hypothetical protein